MSSKMLLHCIAALIVLTALGTAADVCYRFSFTNMSQRRTIQATAGSDVTLPFDLDTSSCHGGWNKSVRIYVHRPPGQNSLRQIYCDVSLSRDRCSSPDRGKCDCRKGYSGSGAEFRKRVSKVDRGDWLWRTEDGLKAEITLNISEAPTRVVTKPTAQQIGTTGKRATLKETKRDEVQLDSSPEEPLSTPPWVKEDSGPKHVDDAIKTGVISASVNIAVGLAILLVVFLLRKRKRAREVKSRCAVNFTPVVEVSEDVITFSRRHEGPSEDSRTTSYVSFGGVMTWSNENISQGLRNGGYVATSQSDQDIVANSPSKP